jgi:hypothetical protein
MRLSAIVGLLTVCACATGAGGGNVGSAGGGDQSGNIKRVIVGNVELGADAQNIGPSSWHDVDAPAATTWRYLPVAFSKLGLSITRYDSTSHIIEGERLHSRADFGGKQLVSMMTCGDVAGMPNVTRFDVNIQVRTVLTGTARRSSVASTVTASAKPSEVSGVLMPCVVSPEASDRVAAAVTAAIKDAK